MYASSAYWDASSGAEVEGRADGRPDLFFFPSFPVRFHSTTLASSSCALLAACSVLRWSLPTPTAGPRHPSRRIPSSTFQPMSSFRLHESKLGASFTCTLSTTYASLPEHPELRLHPSQCSEILTTSRPSLLLYSSFPSSLAFSLQAVLAVHGNPRSSITSRRRWLSRLLSAFHCAPVSHRNSLLFRRFFSATTPHPSSFDSPSFSPAVGCRARSVVLSASRARGRPSTVGNKSSEKSKRNRFPTERSTLRSPGRCREQSGNRKESESKAQSTIGREERREGGRKGKQKRVAWTGEV
jgi:hypothetical protein